MRMAGQPVFGQMKSILSRGWRIRVTKSWQEDADLISRSGMFDPEYYLAANPDVAGSGMDPLEHYVRFGEAEFRNPSASFDTRYYLEANQDVLASGMSPLRHFCEFGRHEGRLATRPHDGVSADHGGDVVLRTDESTATVDVGPSRRILLKSGLFDPDFYLANNPKVARSGIDPAQHYLDTGAGALRDPSEDFSTEYYLSVNRDVAVSGMNPLLHFCRHGWKELRDPSPRFDMGRYWAQHLAGTVEADANPLTHYAAVGKGLSLAVAEVGEIPPSEASDIAERCRRILDEGVVSELSALRLAILLTRLRRWSLVEKALRQALAFNWNVAKTHSRLAEAFERQGKWWQATESLSVATVLDPRHPEWFFRLGDMQEKMDRFTNAASSYRQAIDGNASNPLWHYRLGYVLERAGDLDGSRESYSQAALLDRKLRADRYGEGVFHQHREYWPEAAEAYSARVKQNPCDAELWYRLGFAHDRCFEWESARDAYEVSVSLRPMAAYWHYRLGFVLERMHEWNAAADAYEAAIATSVKYVSYWHYRRGYVLAKAGRYEEACQAYAGANQNKAVMQVLPEAYRRRISKPEFMHALLKQGMPDAQLYYLLGKQYEYVGAWDKAAAAYSDAAHRMNDHSPELYFHLGGALWQAGRFKEACEAFTETVVLRRPLGVDSRRYTRNEHQKKLMAYNEYRECLPVRQRTILYESYAGLSISDNPFALFEYLVTTPGYDEWTHAWVVAEEAQVPARLRSMPNVILVRRDSDLYLRYLATASHLVNNSTFPSWFIRREEQRYLNTWHGTPLKTLMKDIKGTFMERTNTARNLLHCTHLISPNEHTSDVLLRGGDIASIFSGKVAETGYPRIDRMVNASDETKDELRRQLGLVPERPVVLYAPTWRGTFGSGEVEVDRVLADLERMSSADCQLLFRGHYTVAAKLDDMSLPVKVVPQVVDACELLAITDVLVTDYSSIFFDFLPARRPIVYYAYDLEEYAEQRGLYFDMTDLPGALCRDADELIAALDAALGKALPVSDEYARACATFCPYEDGQATRRVVEFFLHDSMEYVTNRYVDARSSILFYAGAFPPQGITASALNLLGSLDYQQQVSTVVIDPAAVSSAPERLERFSMLPDDVHVVGRAGAMVGSAEERWIRDTMNRRYFLPSPRMQEQYLESYRREFARTFGGAKFDAIVDFDGYSIFWASLLGAGGASDTRKVMYMHSDMYAEHLLKFPNLRGLFSTFDHYDVFVSVSRRLCALNREKLSGHYSIDAARFAYCENTINAHQIREKASAPLDEDVSEWIRGRTAFLALGRLSPEKDQAKLVHAFAKIRASHPNVALLVIGDGPLRQDLQQLVLQLGLEDSVFLGGARSNPFPILAASDCLVMSSNHEGQPMVILEAMTLGVPVVATDIDGNRGILEPNGYGLLVENSVDGLAEGLQMFLSGGVPKASFDGESYQNGVVETFQRVVLGQLSTNRS